MHLLTHEVWNGHKEVLDINSGGIKSHANLTEIIIKDAATGLEDFSQQIVSFLILFNRAITVTLIIPFATGSITCS